MTDVDAFNGDADGICALIQLRLAEPRDSELVTGVKRDIALLERVTAKSGDRVTALDISMEKNETALKRLLGSGARVFYADHHAHGEIPDSACLDAHIDTRSDICTSLIINDLLAGRFARWAVTGAFGDNMNTPASSLAESIGLSTKQIKLLQRLGNLINYNGYGANTDDLHFHPASLYRELAKFEDPLDFLAAGTATFTALEEGYREDLARAHAIVADRETPAVAVYSLPDEAWSRRVSGVFGNALASAHPARAHVILSPGKQGTLVVSLRAPLANPLHADEIARQFPSGGGRKRAAGINALPPTELSRLIALMEKTYA